MGLSQRMGRSDRAARGAGVTDASGVMRFGQAGDPFGGGGEQDAVAGLTGPHRQADGTTNDNLQHSVGRAEGCGVEGEGQMIRLR